MLFVGAFWYGGMQRGAMAKPAFASMPEAWAGRACTRQLQTPMYTAPNLAQGGHKLILQKTFFE